MMQRPILYSFRRCPYAMRARLALMSAGIEVELREVILRDKPGALLEASPKGTVPVLVNDQQVIDESRDIMIWALRQNDPEHLLEMPAEGEAWIDTIDGPFKTALDRYKYANRFAGSDSTQERARAAEILATVDAQLTTRKWLFGDAPTLADLATITFVRQYAHVDRAWFDSQNWSGVRGWLDRFLDSERFAAIMSKYPQWTPESPVTLFAGT